MTKASFSSSSLRLETDNPEESKIRSIKLKKVGDIDDFLNRLVIGGRSDVVVSENISIVDFLESIKEYGLMVFDSSGNRTLKLTDSLTRLVYTAVVDAYDSDSTTIPTCSNPIAFSVAMDSFKIAHEVEATTTTVTWTYREAWDSEYSCGWQSSDSLIYVVEYE